MKWIIGLLCLFFLILFHEFGHFLAAKLFGVKVESFSVGFGPILLHKTIKGTDYRLSLIPLGGYCGMKGEKDFEKAIDEDLPYIEGEPDSLYGVHPAKRALIGFAGPFFNFILAFVAFSLINLIGYKYTTYSNKIVIPENLSEYGFTTSPAKDAGLLTGDKIIEINGISITDFSELREQVSLRAKEDLKVKVERDGVVLDFVIKTYINKETGAGVLGILADTSEEIEKETPKYNIFTAFGKGFLDTFRNIGITFKSISVLFKGVKITSAVSGPARVTDIMGSVIQASFAADLRTGFINMFTMIGIISISLCIMNLLPIPVLDGGIILMAIIEIILRKKINPKIQYYIQFVGIAFILILFCIGMFGDISYFIKRGTH